MYFLPIVTSTIAVGLVWAWIYSPSAACSTSSWRVRLPPQRWIADPFWAMPAIIGMSVWQGLPANTIIFLAGLQAIPLAYYDAASVDGGGRWARFRYVTLPLLTPSLFFTGLLSLIGSIQVFDQVFVLATRASRRARRSRSSTSSTRPDSATSRWATRARRRGSCSWSSRS